MARKKPQPAGEQVSTSRLAAFSCVALASLCLGTPAAAQQGFDPRELSLDQTPLFSLDSPIGPIEYRAGRGLHFGRTGLNVGGFTTVEYEDERGESGELALDGVNFLVLLQPVDFVRGFLELEIDDIFTLDTGDGSIDHDPDVVVERVFGELTLDDSLTARLGKFQTPVGRWNLVPAEPFTWTAFEPVVVETAFDEHTTGGALYGTLYPEVGSLRYWVYGQFFDSLDASEDPDPLDRSVGGRLQYDRPLGGWSLGTSFLGSELDDDWSFLGAVDAEAQFGTLLLTSEFTIQEGDIPERDLWSLYLQGVWEFLPKYLPRVYLTARYEHFDRPGDSEDANLGDFGITWIPRPYIRLKANYRASDDQTDDVSDGLKVNFSFVF